ncbi:SAM hydrolase/SAM-dependent halogenase family protein [Actinokineospora pegani]|uniref:SAM hydrolase/SAM-dependent halogenase family protein n=1 Tax=Actinokineospora pegani TaxID=2654637 RepID=UPI0012E9A890|nr:SAM-dependent chlorinase/fluorinase [Actinokineospora pegani]
MGYDRITFTTDYGLADGFPGVCEGVIARIAPAVRVLHLSHGVPPQAVRQGAALLAQAVAHLPDAVHLAVVDPGVGTTRRAVAIRAGASVLVGPDNGLLVPAAEALGGMTTAHEIVVDEPEHATFHGRDVFAPAAAHLALGVDPADFGDPVPDLVRLPEITSTAAPGSLTSEVLAVDGFGNLQLAATAADLATAFPRGAEVEVATGPARLPAVVGRTFADADVVVLADSAGHAAVAVNRGSAAARTGARPGDAVVIS